MKRLAKTFDQEIGVNQVSGDHTRKDVKQDLYKIIRVLKEEVFTNSAVSKTMRAFPNCPRDYSQLLNTGALFKWINEHKRKVSQRLRPRQLKYFQQLLAEYPWEHANIHACPPPRQKTQSCCQYLNVTKLNVLSFLC